MLLDGRADKTGTQRREIACSYPTMLSQGNAQCRQHPKRPLVQTPSFTYEVATADDTARILALDCFFPPTKKAH